MKTKVIMIAILTTILTPLAIAIDNSEPSGIHKLTMRKTELVAKREKLLKEHASQQAIAVVDRLIRENDEKRRKLEQRVATAKKGKDAYLSAKDGHQ